MSAFSYELMPSASFGSLDEVRSFATFDFYHEPKWLGVLHRTFGWPTYYLVITDRERRIVGVLPLVMKRGFMGRPRFVCLPLSGTVGVALVNESPELALSVHQALCSFAREHGSLEVHDLVGGGLVSHQPADVTILNLARFNDVEELRKSYDYKSIRYMINRAHKSGVVVESELSKKGLVNFYDLMVQTRRRQGAPIYPFEFFENMAEAYASEQTMLLRVAYKGEVPLSAAIFFRFKTVMHYAYSASVTDKEWKKLGANETLLASVIEHAYGNGLREFNFGPSPLKLPALKAYKEKWGATSQALLYSYYPERQGLDREGFVVKLGERVLRAVPENVFRRLGPFLLRKVA